MEPLNRNSLITLSFKKIDHDHYQISQINADNLAMLIAKRAMAIPDKTGMCGVDGDYVFSITCDDVNDPDEIGFDIELKSSGDNRSLSIDKLTPIPEDVTDNIEGKDLEELFTTMEPITDFIEQLRASFSGKPQSTDNED